MKNARILRMLTRIESLAWAWVLAIAVALAAAAMFTVPLPGFNGNSGRWILTLALAAAPGLATAATALAIRRTLMAKRARRHLAEVAPQAPLPSVESNTTPPALKSLDEALGAPHMRELRAQVDLLCTMATLERMGAALAEELKHSSVAALALQAAVSAQVVRNILASAALTAELRRSQIRTDGPGVESLKNDLLAISVSLTILGERVRDEHASLTPVWTEIAEREKLTAGLTPVDRLLVQSTLLLSAVSDMARILATIYGRTREQKAGLTPEARNSGEGHFDELELAAGWQDVPVWKLN